MFVVTLVLSDSIFVDSQLLHFFYDIHSKFIITCISIQCFIDRLFSL